MLNDVYLIQTRSAPKVVRDKDVPVVACPAGRRAYPLAGVAMSAAKKR